MLKKRVIILFFAIFSSLIYSENTILNDGSKIFNDSLASIPKNLFIEGQLENGELSIPIIYYQEKNSLGDISISIKQDLNQSKMVFDKDKNKYLGSKNLLNTNVDIEILNYYIRNRVITILEKSSTFKYKNLKSNKILMVEEKNPNNIDNLEESSFITSSNEKYKKIIYIIASESKTILRKEFYLNIDDKTPYIIMDAIDINYIENNYIVTEWEITNLDKKIKIKFNNKTVIVNKNDISNIYADMLSFSGVR
ncbi:MAG: hypothetical protein JXR64_12885 [Spirochaetales bacterium]|nr:hypothetical protein [Spirochaetales bacterium]